MFLHQPFLNLRNKLHYHTFTNIIEFKGLFIYWSSADTWFILFVFVGHLISLLRGLVVRVMGRNGHPHAVEEARKRFKAHCSGGEQIHADLRAPVYVTVLANGDEQTFEEMLKVIWD